jgi:hypothetical protein
VTQFASVHGVAIYGCEVNLRAYFDARGKYGLTDEHTGAQELVYEVALDSDAPEPLVRQMLRDAERACYAHQTFTHPVQVRSTVKLNGRDLSPDA